MTRVALVQEGSRFPAGSRSLLLQLAARGVAYQQGGLTMDERMLVERGYRGYRGGGIHMLAATSTLAAGVNLPAQRVVFK